MTDGGKTVGGAGGIGGIGGSTQRSQPAEPVGVGGKKAAVAGGTAATVGAGSQVAFLMMVLAWLKGLWAMMAAMAMNLLQLIFAFVLFLVSKAVGFFGMIGAGIATATNAVAGFFGMGAQIAGTAAVSIANVTIGAGVSVAVVASVFTGVNLTTGAQETARADALLIDCSVELAAALDESGAPTPGSETMMANAETIYSVFSAWGMPDENIAGILGNWEQESGMDPTRVQNTANTPYIVSDAEQAGAENTDNGIGLGQWTFGRNTNLRAYADSHSASWGALEIQLGFMLSPAEGGNADVVRHMISTSLGTPGDAAVYFHDEWERSADTSMATRIGNAERWMGLLSGWEANQELADSILAQAGTSVEGAGENAAAAARQECVNAEETVALGEGTMGEGASPVPAGMGSVTSTYGPRDCSDGISSCFHRGVDIGGVGGTSGDQCVRDIPISSISKGVVVFAPDPGYGSNNALAIKYSDRLTFYYLHMGVSSFTVSVGDAVEAGDQIGLMGSYGQSTGCHLHIETHIDGERVDPVPVIEEGFGVPLPR